MTLDNLLQDYRKRDIVPPRQSSVGVVDRAEKTFDLSVQENIPLPEADSILLSQELMDFTRTLDESPLYQDMDGLIDVFDPSEPPAAGEGVPDPMGELLKAEIAAVRESVKWALKAASFIFSPRNRAFKFITNAMMYDPLTRSVTGSLKKATLESAIAQEKFRIKQEEALKIRKEKGLPTTQFKLGLERLTSVLSKEKIAEIDKEVDERAVGSVKLLQAEDVEDVKVVDFLKSGKDALKSLVPWPGFADDVKSFGEISADSYKRITGQQAPTGYGIVSDIALETTAIGGLVKMAWAAKAKDAASLSRAAKLTKSEIRAIKRLHKAASQTKKVPIKSTTVPSQTDAATVTQKLIRLIKEAKPLRDRKSLLLHRDRQQKAAKLATVQKNVEGARLVRATKGALKGKAPIPDFTPLAATAKRMPLPKFKSQGAIGIYEEGLFLPDSPRELAKVIRLVRKNEGDEAAALVKAFQSAGIETVETHATVNEIIIRALNLSKENKALLQKTSGVIVKTFKGRKGDFITFKRPPVYGLTTQEVDVLFNLVNTSQLGVGFDKGRAFLSLDKLLKGTLITKSEIANLEAVFGKELTKALFRKQSIASIIQDVSFEVINLPRAILASFDLSAAGRQGIIFSVSHPVASMKAFGRSVRAAASLKYADDIERITKTTRFGKLADRFGVHSSPTGFAARLSSKEEVYMSRIAEKIPGIAASERAFTTFLNQQRREVFALQAKKWIKRGITPKNNSKAFQDYAKFVNHATGRGSLEDLQPGALTAMNALFFSPRFQVSRIQVVGDLVSPKTTLLARKVIARDLAEFYATGMGIMAMAKMAGAEVETDPRSSDFGKIKVGETRYNYWGAFQPMATLAGRIYSGEIKSTGTGKIKKKERISLGIDNTVVQFLRTKLSPVAGRGFDVMIGETFLGEPVEPTAKFLGKTAFESLVPLFIQDSVDAWRFQGADAQLPISAGLAFTGIGVQTWEIAPFAELELARDSLSRQTFGKNYDQLSWTEVTELDRDILVNHPGIVDLERETKFESESVRFLMKQALEERKSERFLEKNISKKLLADLNEIKLSVGGVSRVFGNWRLNDEQYKEYQKRVADNINKLFKETESLWDTKNTDGKYEIMTTLLRSAKLLAGQEMRIGDME